MGKIKMLLKYYLVIFIIVFFLSLIFLSILNKKAMPILINYAKVQTKRIGMEVLRDVGTNEINNLIKDKKLFEIKESKNGEIESIDFNTEIINEALSVASDNVQKRLEETEKGIKLPDEMYLDILDKSFKKGIVYQIPLGVISGSAFFYNIGPKIPVKIKYSGNVGLDAKSKVSEYGINSALIEIYIKIQVTQRTILPFTSDDVKLSSDVPIIMKIIKGNVPNYISKDLPANE